MTNDRTYRWIYHKEDVHGYPDAIIEGEKFGNHLISYSRSKYDRIYDAAKKRLIEKLKND